MKVYGLVGKKLSHSFSKAYFEKKFAAAQTSDCRYENFELSSIQNLSSLLKSRPEIRGLNVTIPYKESVIPLLQRMDEKVKVTGACNCIRVEADGSLTGFNTDVTGFQNSLQKHLPAGIDKALVFGTGGASKAAQYALAKMGIAHRLVSSSGAENSLSYEQIGEEMLRTHRLLVNTTPVGTWPAVDEKLPLPYQFLTRDNFLFDLIYNPEKTAFLEEGEKAGAGILNGYEMLVLQAEESWKIWNENDSTTLA